MMAIRWKEGKGKKGWKDEWKGRNNRWMEGRREGRNVDRWVGRKNRGKLKEQ